MTPWWREAVVYQIYVRSFADSDGDGVGDLPGICSRLSYVADLGVDAIWLTPFYPSPLADGGYDVADYRAVDPVFGTLEDLDALLVEAHALGLKVIVDVVPNHCSDQHAWFRAAVEAGPGSPERDRFHFRPVDPAAPDEPPNDWPAAFGGRAWDRVVEADGSLGEWYLHLFTPEQPDFNWDNPDVVAEFEAVLRFWLDRGVDGFRVDVAHGLVKESGLPALGEELHRRQRENTLDPDVVSPMWDQPGVHEIYRGWRRILNGYPGDRMMVGEVWLGNAEALARYLRHDEMHQAFNFRWLFAPWDAGAVRQVIDSSLAEAAAVSAPATWVLSNHDVYRHATRYGDGPLGLARARAITMLMHALPGSGYVYQGEELGLPEVLDLPEDALQDPTWERSGHTVRGRDGCRVPIPWSGQAQPYGFGPDGSAPWLPQPDTWAELSVEAQDGVAGSTLSLYRDLLAARRRVLIDAGPLTWLDGLPPEVLGFSRGDVTCLINFTSDPVELPESLGGLEVLISSDPAYSGGSMFPGATATWLTPTPPPS